MNDPHEVGVLYGNRRCSFCAIFLIGRDALVSRVNAKSFDSTALYVIASEAKQSPIPWIEIASSLRSSQ